MSPTAMLRKMEVAGPSGQAGTSLSDLCMGCAQCLEGSSPAAVTGELPGLLQVFVQVSAAH